jgi:hypothetical protein
VKITEKAPIFELVGHQIENLNQTRNSKPLKLSLPQSSRQILVFFPHLSVTTQTNERTLQVFAPAAAGTV